MKITKAIACCLAILVANIAYALNQNELLSSVKQHFPLILKEKAKLEEALQLERASFGAFDPSIDGHAKFVPNGGYVNRQADTRLNLPIDDSPLRLYSSYRIGRGEWPIYEQKQLTNENGEIQVGLTYPLIRDNIIDANRANLYKSTIGVDIAKANLDYQYLQVTRDALAAFWKWQGAIMKKRVAKVLLDIAQMRQKQIQGAVDLGDMPNIELVENSRLIMQRRTLYVRAKQQEFQAAQQLSLYYRNRQGKPIVLKPTTRAEHISLDSTFVSLRNFNTIIRYQPQLLVLNNLIKKEEVDTKLFRNNAKPTLDLDVFYKQEFGDGNDRLADASANIGLRYRIPLLNRKAHGNLAAALQRIKAFRFDKRLFIERLRVFVNSTLNDINTIIKAHELQQKELTFAQKLEDAERLRFQSGDSSLFLVNQREQVVAFTQNKLIDLAIGYRLSKNDLAFSCAYKKRCISSLVTHLT